MRVLVLLYMDISTSGDLKCNITWFLIHASYSSDANVLDILVNSNLVQLTSMLIETDSMLDQMSGKNCLNSLIENCLQFWGNMLGDPHLISRDKNDKCSDNAKLYNIMMDQTCIISVLHQIAFGTNT